MRFMLMFKTDQDVDVPACKDLDEMKAFIGDLTAAGVLLATEGLHPSAKGAHVRLAGGRVMVTDGPFTEAKELVAGFALVRVPSKDEAIALSQRFLTVAGSGACEVRQVFEASDAAGA
jgi:hypothetical protein